MPVCMYVNIMEKLERHVKCFIVITSGIMRGSWLLLFMLYFYISHIFTMKVYSWHFQLSKEKQDDQRATCLLWVTIALAQTGDSSSCLCQWECSAAPLVPPFPCSPHLQGYSILEHILVLCMFLFRRTTAQAGSWPENFRIMD
jgi:hypothetical protein